MAIMSLSKTIVKQVKPTIVNMAFEVNTEGKDPKAVLSELNNKLTLFKTICTELPSYRSDSYVQQNIKFTKLYKTVVRYKNLKTGEFYTEAQFAELCVKNGLDTKIEIKSYEKFTDRVFDKYVASTTITCTLNKTDSVVDDFVRLANTAIEQDFTCRYEHNITNDERMAYMTQLYSTGIDSAINEIKTILSNSSTFANVENITIRNISDRGISNVEYDAAPVYRSAKRTETYTPEQYFIPELIQELFNNNIDLSKTVELEVEF